MDAVWLLLGARAPRRVKRMAYISKADGAGLSALETCVLSRADYRAIGKQVVGHLRFMMGGRACKWEVDRHPVAMKSVEVQRAWRLLPSALALRMARLKWLQGMVSDQAAHAQVIAAMLGTYRLEKG